MFIYNVWTCTNLFVAGFPFHHHSEIPIFCNFVVVRTASVGKTPKELVVRNILLTEQMCIAIYFQSHYQTYIKTHLK